MSMEQHTHSHTHRHNAHNPSITISSFEVSGNHKTQLALFENEFAQSCEAKKFHELEGELSVALQRMREMDLFSSVDTQVRVLTPEKERASGSGDTKIAVLVVVKEKNMPSLKAETFFGNEGNNVGASIQGQLRNLTGFGDLLKLSYGTNSAGSKDTHLTYTIPSVTRKLHSLDFITRIYDDNSLSTFSSFHKNALSMAASLSTVDRRHKLTLQSVIRDEVPVPSSFESSNLASSTPSNILSNVNANSSNQSALSNPSFFGLLQSINTVHKHTSPAVLALLSPSTKTSLTYSHTKDSRDSSSHPTNGSLFSSSVELAVPPGSAQYVRADISLEKHSTLLASKSNPSQRIVGSLCGSFATTRVLDFTSLWSTDISDRDDNNVHINGKGERKLCHMSDRLFLGGPLSLRGLNLNGAGPRSFRRSPTDSASIEPGLMSKPPDVGDALGGLTKITALAALSSPLPFSHQAAESIKTILFLNGAVLLPHTVFPLAAPNSATHSDILSCLRLSVGAGLSYSMGPVRLELTYALPLLTSSHDNTKSFQIGVALGMNSS